MHKKIQNYSFYLSESIGQGYSSHVYRGKNDITNEAVAIKVIDMNKIKQNINKQLLKSQIQLLKLFSNSQYILNLHNVYTTKNNTYIITQLCSNDLESLIRKQKKLTEEQAIKYMKQILIAYRQMYEHSIVHRDLKPANILITEQNQVKIADFGFAIKSQNVHTQSKYNVGSPVYMPLQALKDTDYSFKSDIWSLGIIYYQMITGKVPWRAKNQKDLIQKIQTESINFNSMNISKNSKIFLEKTLQKDKLLRAQPEEIINFNFINTPPLILHSPFNVMERTIYRQFSNRLNENNKSIRKLDLSKTLQSEHQKKLSSVSKDSYPINDKMKAIICNPKLPQRNVTAPLNVDKKMNKCNEKAITKILISQVHYCRFLYKLLTRILGSYENGILKQSKRIKEVQKCYINIIKYKLQLIKNIYNNNFIDTEHHQQYKNTHACKNVAKIATNYIQKYSEQFAQWDISQQLFSQKNWPLKSLFESQSTQQLIKQICQKLLEVIANQSDVDKHKNQIIILDYLMTSKQLLKLAQMGDFYKFSRNSRIQQIVEGSLTDINYAIYCKIISKSVLVINGYIKKQPLTQQK